ncbi:MAG: hypothetical protein OXC13_13840 [Caldilineaceae bacterium]|nr:hypothetical protein [Caldilineaceae bacterium]
MRKLLFLVLVLPLALTACVVPPMPATTDTAPPSDQDWSTMSDLPDLGPAPEIANTVWINSDRPLRLAELEGKVVLIDMWTFG